MDADPFLDYLDEHDETESLAESLREVIAARRASAERLVLAGRLAARARIEPAQQERVAS